MNAQPFIDKIIDAGGKVEKTEDGVYTVTLNNGVKVNAYGLEDLMVTYGTFVSGYYNLQIPSETIVFDIGAHIGTTALFFASQPNVSKVFAWELFPSTAKIAVENLKKNDAFANKVTLQNIGLYNQDMSKQLPYRFDIKGSCGLYGVDQLNVAVTEQEKPITNEDVTVKKASNEIGPLLKQIGSAQKSILKIDAEGAEYEIIDDLLTTGNLLFDSILMEWHRFEGHEPEQLHALLLKNGYSVLSLKPYEHTHSLMHAFKI